MNEINSEIPFLWRLDAQENGWCTVKMVVPVKKDGQYAEHAIPTSVTCLIDETMDDDEDLLEWSEEDLSLFFKLISRNASNSGFNESPGKKGVHRVDLSDPHVVDAVKVVAAASFGVVFDGDDYLVNTDSSLPCVSYEVGSQVSIFTVAGFKSCIIVDEDEESVVCVLLDKVDSGVPGYIDNVNPYDLILLKRHQVLESQYSSQIPGKSDTLH